jgi:NAD(P)-dependent dehydrogenase (short-subunit alcohol dehydrogenase family)
MLVAKESRITECGARVLVLHPGWVDTDMGRMGNRTAITSVEESTEGLINIIDKAVEVQRSTINKKEIEDRKDWKGDDIKSDIWSSNCSFLKFDGEKMAW